MLREDLTEDIFSYIFTSCLSFKTFDNRDGQECTVLYVNLNKIILLHMEVINILPVLQKQVGSKLF